MCLKGGPRCHTHAKDAYDKTSAKWEKALAQEHSLQKQINELPEESTKRGSLEKKLKVARTKLESVAEKKHEALVESRETAQGVELLKEKAAQAKAENPGSMKAKRLFRDYLEAEAGYNAKLKKYDIDNKTVDAKLPSGYASAIGLSHLNKLQENNLKAFHKADPADKEAARKFEERKEAIQAQIDHAKKTLERIYAGELPRQYAPPSPSLQKTKEFQSYLQSAHAAPDMKTTSAELRRVGLSGTGQALVHPRSSGYPAYIKKQKAIAERLALPPQVKEDPKPDYKNVVRIEDLPYEERKRRESEIRRNALISGRKLVERTPEIQGQGELF